MTLEELKAEGDQMLEEWRTERDKAFINFVTTGDPGMVRKYCQKYGVPIPKSTKVFAVGIYQAVLLSTNIPEDIKKLAMQKCLAIGFNPVIRFCNMGGEEEC